MSLCADVWGPRAAVREGRVMDTVRGADLCAELGGEMSVQTPHWATIVLFCFFFVIWVY